MKLRLLGIFCLFIAIDICLFAPPGGGSGGGSGGALKLSLSHKKDVKWAGTGSNKYDCFDASTYEQIVDGPGKDFYVKYSAGEDTDFFITFSDGGAGSYNRVLTLGAYDISYQLYAGPGQSSVLKAIPDASASDTIEGHVTDAGDPRKQSQNYYYVIFPEQIVPPGEYKDKVAIKLYKGNFSGVNSQDASKNVDFKATVPAILRLFIGESGGFLSEVTNYNLDFQVLEENEFRSLDLKILSNAGFEILLNSANSGFLKHSSYASIPIPFQEGHRIPYVVTFDGTGVNLISGTDQLVQTEGQMTPANGLTFDLTVTIGSISQKMHGDYADTLVVTARAI
jgi:hypothetical protein